MARELGDASGAEARVGGEERGRVVAPGVGEVERGQVALVDPGGDRHEFHRAHPEAGEVLDDRRGGEGRDGAAEGGGHVGVQAGEAADLQLVDQAAGPEDRGAERERRRKRGDDRAGHPGGAVAGGRAGGGEAGIPGEGAVEGDGVGVDEELRGVEPQAGLRSPGSVGAQAVAGAGPEAGNEGGPGAVGGAAEGDAVGLDAGGGIEEAGPEAFGGAGPDGEAGAVRAGGGAERGGHAGHGQALRGRDFQCGDFEKCFKTMIYLVNAG